MSRAFLIFALFIMAAVTLYCQNNLRPEIFPANHNKALQTQEIVYTSNESFFLINEPVSSESFMLGATGVSRLTDDPLAVAINPAQLGMQSLGKKFSVGYSFINEFKYYIPKWYKNYAVTAGIALHDIIECELPISFGLGYSHLLGAFPEMVVRTFENPSNEQKTEPSQSHTQFSFGVVAGNTIKLAAGLTFKHSKESFPDKLDHHLYDYGVILDIPVNEVFPVQFKISGNSQQTISPFTNLRLGYVKKHCGDDGVGPSKFAYLSGYNRDSLYTQKYVPTTIQTGISLDIGTRYAHDSFVWEPFRVSFTVEESDVLPYLKYGKYTTKSGITGDIDFWNDIVLGYTNSRTTKHKGIRIDFGETFSLLNGSKGFKYVPFKPEITSGWMVNSSGLIKVVTLISGNFVKSPVLNYILLHLNMQYSQGICQMDIAPYTRNSEFREKSFYSLNISWTNN